MCVGLRDEDTKGIKVGCVSTQTRCLLSRHGRGGGEMAVGWGFVCGISFFFEKNVFFVEKIVLLLV